MRAFFTKFDQGLSWVERTIAAVLLLLSVALIVCDVVLRAGFSYALSWAGEATRYAIIWLVFVAGSIGARSSAHISIDFLAETLPPRLAHRVAQLAAIISSVTCGLVAWFGWSLVIQMQKFGQISPSLEWPMWVIYLSVPMGAALMSLRFLQSAVSVDLVAARAQTALSAA
jgi:C4-dicarboxylate transporter, DctQ subunit